MSITCKFKLSRTSNIYYSGEEITGSVILCSLKQCRIEEIVLEFYGESTVHWWETDKTKENIMHNDISIHEVSNKKLYKRQQKHVSEQLKLDLLNGKQLLQQPLAECTFHFCFTIPQQVPATYCCRYGQTVYGLRLKMQRIKKVNKEFHQRILVKNKLDLTQDIINRKPSCISDQNEFGQINLQIPCSGFTPGQKIPYYYKYQTPENDCKLLIQFNCYTICRVQSHCNTFKQIKKTINYKEHVTPAHTSYVSIPLYTHISSIDDPELILSSQYTLEAFLVKSNKKALLRVTMPLAIGSTPCRIFNGDWENYMCYDNFGSPFTELVLRQTDDKLLQFSDVTADQQYGPFCILPV